MRAKRGKKQLTNKELQKKLEEWKVSRDYPEVDTHKYIEFHLVYPMFTYAPYEIKNNRRIPIDKIYGDNWAFQNKENRGSYPYSNKLDSLFRGYTRKNNSWGIYANKKIPPVPVVKIFDDYFLDEGNHRLYLSKLLGRKTIVADVVEYDYEYFLKNSFIKTFGNTTCVIYDTYLYPIDEDYKENYLRLKDKIGDKK